MKKGLIFSLKLLFETFLIGIFVSVIFELVFLRFAKLFDIDIYLNIEVFMTILVASFLTFIFSRKNIVNHLFINGFSRNKISTVKILSCLIYGLIFFSFFVIYEVFYGELVSNITNLSTIIHLILVYFFINLISEFATFLNFLYKNISIKKGKGINKSFYRYIYSFVFIVLTYIYRFIYPNVQNYYTNIVLILLVILTFGLQVLFAYVNKKWILRVDIRA